MFNPSNQGRCINTDQILIGKVGLRIHERHSVILHQGRSLIFRLFVKVVSSTCSAVAERKKNWTQTNSWCMGRWGDGSTDAIHIPSRNQVDCCLLFCRGSGMFPRNVPVAEDKARTCLTNKNTSSRSLYVL